MQMHTETEVVMDFHVDPLALPSAAQVWQFCLPVIVRRGDVSRSQQQNLLNSELTQLSASENKTGACGWLF